MGESVLGATVLFILIYGLCRVRHIVEESEGPRLWLVLNEVNYAEALIRQIVKNRYLQTFQVQLWVLVEYAHEPTGALPPEPCGAYSGETYELVCRLAAKLGFRVARLHREEELSGHRLQGRVFDLRDAGTAAHRLLYEALQDMRLETHGT